MKKKLDKNAKSFLFSVAPMQGLTDRHCRYFLRCFSKYSLLYTEMITADAIIHNSQNKLYYSKEEKPLVLQIAGNDPKKLAYCSKIAEDKGYDEINLNIGCPSNKVSQGMFGASLMKNAPLVAQCVTEMNQAVSLPITVKTRLGIDAQDSYEFIYNFIKTITEYSNCRTFILHARKAYLSGLNPKENRSVPPLNYSYVYRIKKDFPNLRIIINGGISSLSVIQKHLKYVDGVMLGRKVYSNPSFLIPVDKVIFNSRRYITNSIQAIRMMYPYIENELQKGTKLNLITRHMLGVFRDLPGAKEWRRNLSKNTLRKKIGIEFIEDSLKIITRRN